MSLRKRKKDNPRLMKVKLPVYDPRAGKIIERTYYIDPNKDLKKNEKIKNEFKTDLKNRNKILNQIESEDFKKVFKVAFCEL
jgi:hypothetical protein